MLETQRSAQTPHGELSTLEQAPPQKIGVDLTTSPLSWISLRSPFQEHIQHILTRSTLFIMLIILIFGILGSSIGAAAAAYADYRSLTILADNGITAIKRLPDDLGFAHGKLPTAISNAQANQGNADLDQALTDFTAIQNRLSQPDLFLSTAANIPALQTKLHSAVLLSELAIHGLNIGKMLFPSLVTIANVVLASPIVATSNANSTPALPQPSLSTNDIAQLQQSLQQMQPDLQSIIQLLQTYPSDTLLSGLSTTQRAKLAPYLSFIPQIPQLLPTIQSFLTVAPNILGSERPTAYLLVFMDPSELRAAGGFQGNYAIVTVDGGKIGAIHLQDIYLLDKPFNSTYPGDIAAPPAAYQGWWPFAPWGIRDANLSPDFPTTAALDLQQLMKEGGNIIPVLNAQGIATSTKTVDISGVIAIEPTIIEQMLAASGPIQIDAPYNVVVTAQNVQDLIHFFQLTPQGRALGSQVQPGQQVSSANKRFTALVAEALLKKLVHLASTDWMTLGQNMLNDTLTKDIQLYSSDPVVERYIAGNHAASSVYTGTDDALLVVDSNVSGNKGTRFLTEQVQDHIQLQKDGSAIHTVTIAYDWHPPEIASGFDATAIYNALYNANYTNNGLFYREYVRVYTSTSASLTGYSGWQSGIESVMSDFPGRGMFGGHMNIEGDIYSQPVTWTVPTLSLRYVVPHAFTPGSEYTLVLQRQAGLNAIYSITIDNTDCHGQAQSHDIFSGVLTSDQRMSVNTLACST